jgi:predicted nucleotidyltransferase
MSRATQRCVKARHYAVLERAKRLSDDLISQADRTIGQFLASKGESLEGLCFAVVGSVGRSEALEASDFDVLPIADTKTRLAQYRPHDLNLRRSLSDALKVKVSEGQDLTKATSIEELIEVDSIGGSADTSGRLTKRVLLLTESRQAAGKLSLRKVREELLVAYAGQERTSGRHVLSLCNDIARYYKTLCIEYKAKADEQNKDWSTRNIKLRHSRKVWYFANITAMATLADLHPQGEDAFLKALLDAFDEPPISRLATAICDTQPLALGRLVENYVLFLDFMSKLENREALAKVPHSDRYKMELGNPFPMMKYSSDVIHQEIMSIMEEMGPALRARIMGWFLL